MSTYFSNFPLVTYNGISVRDVTRRTDFIDNILSNPYVFLPYTVKDGERPEDIAYHYYGSVNATWLVLMANNIIDPYTQWHMRSEVFHEYLISKYQEQSGMIGYDVIYWTQNETILDNIVHYYKITENDVEIRTSPDTFPYLYDVQNNIVGREVAEGWLPLRIYDYETIINENKREILVVENQYYDQINKEFKRLIKQ